MGRNVVAIIAIFLCTTFAWMILGLSIVARTDDSRSGLGPQVESTWGQPQQQLQPVAFKTVAPNDALPLERSRVQAALKLEQRQKGLLWFPTYRVDYRGDYIFRNNTEAYDVTLRLPFPCTDAVYDDLTFRVNGQPVAVNTASGAAIAVVSIPPGALFRLETGYRSRGMRTWHYAFADGGVNQVRDFILDLRTDFNAIDFPQETLSPTEKRKTPDGWLLTWKYTNLITGSKIGMIL